MEIMLPYFSQNAPLPEADGYVNALCVYDFFVNGQGWTKEATCGMIANMWYESQCNPGRWENSEVKPSNGYGIVQWTPSTKYIYWANDNGYNITEMEGQVQRILYEKSKGFQFYSSYGYPMTFSQFSESTLDPGYLAEAFLANYERPGSYTHRYDSDAAWQTWLRVKKKRHDKGVFFFEMLTGMEVPNPNNPSEDSKKLSLLDLILYTRKGR